MTTPPDIKVLLERVQTLTDLERYPEAIRAAQEALTRFPGAARALCALSWAQSHTEQREEALLNAERACAADPALEWGHRLRAIHHQDREEYAEAVAAAREAARLSPRNSSDLFVLADALMHAGQLEEAREVALRMREVAPESVWSHEMCGGVALKGKQYAEAEAHFRRGLALDPQRYICLYNLGLSLLYQGRPREAVDCFTQAQMQRPQDTRAPWIDHNLRVAIKTYLGDNKKTKLPTETVDPEERQRRWDSLPDPLRQWYTLHGNEFSKVDPKYIA